MEFWFLTQKNLTRCLVLTSNNKIANSGMFDRIALVFGFFYLPLLSDLAGKTSLQRKRVRSE
jgi:hypothetical protein